MAGLRLDFRTGDTLTVQRDGSEHNFAFTVRRSEVVIDQAGSMTVTDSSGKRVTGKTCLTLDGEAYLEVEHDGESYYMDFKTHGSDRVTVGFDADLTFKLIKNRKGD